MNKSIFNSLSEVYENIDDKLTILYLDMKI